MIVLSLFDGMSCGQIALKELGINVEKYYASEIDKHAIKQTQLNFPSTIQLGDVEKWREWDIDWAKIGLVLAGSPCQGFSFAGKQLAFNDPRSRLFFVFVEIFNHIKKFNPNVKFLLENVGMKREYLRVISEMCGVFPVNINSSLVSAQLRNRWYWTNIRTKQVGLFGEVYVDIPQPEDKGIVLRDILENNVAKKYYLKDSVVKKLLEHKERSREKGSGFGAVFHSTESKMSALKVGGRNIDDLIIIQLPRGKNKGGIHKEKTPTLSANSFEQNNLVVLGNLYPEHNSQSGRIYATTSKGATIRGEGGGCGGKTGLYQIGERIRRLTPTECARLQTIPEWYKWECSETQQYRMLGNGWTIGVVKHILSYFPVKLKELEK